MRQLTLEELREVVLKKNYRFFQAGQFNMNIIGIRSNNSKSNSFDDYLYIAYRNENSVWVLKCFNRFTTDPGKPWLLKPMDKDGTAVLVPGQYMNVYQVGVHGRTHASGGYQALEQIRSMAYVRDNNKDSVIDRKLYSDPSKIFWANLKTNLHRASKNVIVRLVETHSAGCQVLAADSDLQEVLFACKRGIAQWGNSLTYTLLEESDF
jgi:hypothetical protein